MATNNRFITSYNGLVGVYYPSPTGLVDIRTGQPYVGGGLYQGAVTELTGAEAASLSLNQANPVYGGRYRFVAIDPGATAANLGFGKVVGWCPGLTLGQVSILTAGSGQTGGTYTATASAGGATIQYVISGAGTLVSVTLLNAGSYADNASIPTFTIAAGGTPGTVVAQWAVDQNTVTSMDLSVGVATGGIPRGIALGGPPTASDLANPAYMWIVENGKANVLGSSATPSGPAAGQWVNSPTSPNGTVVSGTGASFGTNTLGICLDIPQTSALYRVELTLPNFGG